MRITGALPNLLADLFAWSIVGFISMLGILYSYAFGRSRTFPPHHFMVIVVTISSLLIVGLHIWGRLRGTLEGIGGQDFSLITIMALSIILPYWLAYSRFFEKTFVHVDYLIVRGWNPNSLDVYRRDERSSDEPFSASPRNRRNSNGGRRRRGW